MATYSELHYVYEDEDGEDVQSDEVSTAEIKELLASGVITAATKVWQDGMEDWEPIGNCAVLFGLEDAFDGEGVPPELEVLHYAYIDDDGEPAQSDEVSTAEIKELLASGTITAATKVWQDGMDDWIPLADCADRFGLGEALAEAGQAPEPDAEAAAGEGAEAREQSVHYSLGDDPVDEVSLQWKNPDFLLKNPDLLSGILISC